MHLSLSHKKMDSIMLFYALSSAAAVVTTITKSVRRKKTAQQQQHQHPGRICLFAVVLDDTVVV